MPEKGTPDKFVSLRARIWGIEMRLRNRGVYSLPNGRELVAKDDLLFVKSELNSIDSDYYELNQAGRLLNHGRLTAWDISDLRDTGATAHERL